MKLEHRVAIVTGAAQGIGKAIAEKLTSEGATVVAADVQGDGAKATADELGGTAVEMDISVEADAQRMVDEALSAHGKVDVLVNAAAIVPFVVWDDVDFDYWRKIISGNLGRRFPVPRRVGKANARRGYGRIVQIASNAFYAGTPN